MSAISQSEPIPQGAEYFSVELIEESAMFVRTYSDRTARPHTLDDIGMASGSNAIVNLNEFTYKRGTEICGEKEPAEYVYQVKKGAVRSYKLLSDGRRQIAAFHLVGDIFGLVNGESHRFTAEAVVETTLRLINVKALKRLRIVILS